MKDSGIEWIGEIPEGWKVGKIKYFYDIVLGKMLCPEQKNVSETYEYYLCAQNITENGLNLTVLKKMWFSPYEKSIYRIDKGDILVVEGGNAGLCAIYNNEISPCYIQNALHKAKSKGEHINKFLFYWMKFVEKSTYINQIVNKATISHYTKDKFGNTPLAFPLPYEQQRIADYLDAKCAHIDQCLELTRQSMEKLRAYKLSCITEAVTKGLDPDVPLKDSGVPWIGQIPQHCRCVAVNKLFYLILGKMLSDKPKNHDDSLEEYICALNVHFYGIDYDSLKKMWFSKNEKFTYKVMNNDLLVVEGGAGAGGSYIATNIQNKKIYIQNSIIIAREKESISNTRFLYYTLFSLVKRNYIDFICNKATIPHFTKEKLGRTVLVLFPLPEQERIAAYLDKKCARIDALLEEKQALLDKLAEYKKSLIFECVTGKREVPSCWNR